MRSLNGATDHFSVDVVYPSFSEDVSTAQGALLVVDLLVKDSKSLLFMLEGLVSHLELEGRAEALGNVLGADDVNSKLCVTLQIDGLLGPAVAEVRVGLQGNTPIAGLHQDCTEVSLASSLSQAIWPRAFRKTPQQDLSEVMLRLHVEECCSVGMAVVEGALIANACSNNEQDERQKRLAAHLCELEMVLASDDAKVF